MRREALPLPAPLRYVHVLSHVAEPTVSGRHDEPKNARRASNFGMARILLGAAVALALAGCGGADPQPEGQEESADIPPGLADGFETDFSKHSVPLTEFQSGGPPKDGIPPIDEPRFIGVDAVDFLDDREPVIELEVAGEARGYPIQILMWHEIVNDTIGGVPVAVTFCPLCNTAIAFDRRLDGRTLDFGTTGKLRNSDLVMYDRQTESWWQQFGGDAIVGQLTGSRLERIPARIVSWAEFARAHPDGRVLSRETGHSRPYGENPYAGYDDVDSPPFFPTSNSGDDRLSPKERVVYVKRGGESVAVPFSVLERRKQITITVGGDELVVKWRPGVASSLDDRSIEDGRDVGAAEVREGGKLVAFEEPFWFAVASFDPDVRVVP